MTPRSKTRKGDPKEMPKDLFLREDDAVVVLTRSETEKCRVFTLPDGFLTVITDPEEDLLRISTEKNLPALAQTLREDFLANDWKIRHLSPELVLPKT